MSIFKYNLISKDIQKQVYKESFLKTDTGLCLLTHPDFEIYDVNDSFSDFFDCQTEDLKGKLFAEIWKKCKERDEFFTTIIRNGHAAPDNTEIIRPNGTTVSLTISGVMLSEDMILITVF